MEEKIQFLTLAAFQVLSYHIWTIGHHRYRPILSLWNALLGSKNQIDMGKECW